jgi:hypothetical protein
MHAALLVALTPWLASYVSPGRPPNFPYYIERCEVLAGLQHCRVYSTDNYEHWLAKQDELTQLGWPTASWCGLWFLEGHIQFARIGDGERHLWAGLSLRGWLRYHVRRKFVPVPNFVQ